MTEFDGVDDVSGVVVVEIFLRCITIEESFASVEISCLGNSSEIRWVGLEGPNPNTAFRG